MVTRKTCGYINELKVSFIITSQAVHLIKVLCPGLAQHSFSQPRCGIRGHWLQLENINSISMQIAWSRLLITADLDYVTHLWTNKRLSDDPYSSCTKVHTNYKYFPLLASKQL